MRYSITDFGLDLSQGLFLIAGPCVIESRDHVLFMASELKKITSSFKLPFVFKASYDKANRTSIKSYRGPGVDEGLNLLREVRNDAKLKHIPFVMVTAESKTENVIAAKEAGVTNYIVKPFNAETLKQKLVAVFGNF